MSLIADYNYQYGLDISPTTKFDLVKRRMSEKKQLIEDLQNEYNLLEQQALGLYKTRVTYPLLGNTIIEGADKWLHMVKSGTDSEGKKLDRRKKYKEKDDYNYIYDYVKGLLGLDDFELIRFIDYNYGTKKEIEFASHGHKWELHVPIIKHITIKDYRLEQEFCFKLCIYHNEGFFYEYVGSTFEEDELKDIMAKGIEKYCEVEDGESKN